MSLNFSKPIYLFCENLWISTDRGELETLAFGNRVILNDTLLKEVFKSEYSGNIPFIHGNLCLDQF